MSMSNLPPGVSPSDIPGNRPIDEIADRMAELFAAAYEHGMTEEDVRAIWLDVERQYEQMAEQAYERKLANWAEGKHK